LLLFNIYQPKQRLEVTKTNKLQILTLV